MKQKIFVYDPTASDKLSSVRGIGRYLQILKENFSREFQFVSDFKNFMNFKNFKNSVFVNPFFNFLKPPLILRRIAKKQIAVIHDLIPLKYPRHFPAGVRGNINIFLNKLALKNYDVIITDSEASKADIINVLRIEKSKIKVVYPCLPKVFQINQKTENRSQKSEDRESESAIGHQSSDLRHQYSDLSEFCLYVGDATWNKNLVNIARAIKIANVTCVFVGKVFEILKRAQDDKIESEDTKFFTVFCFPLKNFGIELSHPWQKELKEFYGLIKDDKRFIFAGFISDSELFKLYEQASVNLLISRAEGFGFSYLEAANFSCPSLLSDIPVLREISNNQALFADPKNPRDIADKINEIFFDKVLRNKMGTAAKKRSEFFSAKKFKKEFLAVI